MRSLFLLIIFTGVSLFPAHLFAYNDSFRCGSNLISLGDTMYEVRQSCGEPYSTEVIGERSRYKILKQKRYKIESNYLLTEWIYESNDGIYSLVFEGSRLVKKEFIFQ